MRWALWVCLAACSFPTSGGDPTPGPGSVDAASPADADVAADAVPGSPTVTITDPMPSSIIVGSRTITVRGAVIDSTDVAVSIAGTSVLVAATVAAGMWEAELELRDNDNLIVAEATNSVGTADAMRRVLYPFLRLPDFAPADRVIGQPDFTSGVAPADPTDAVLLDPWGGVAASGTTLFVPDSGHNRVLAFDPIPTGAGAAADFLLGQVDATSDSSGTSASKFDFVQGLTISGSKLLATDLGNSRMLLWNAIPTANAAPANVVIGQTMFGGSGAGCQPGRANEPESSFLWDAGGENGRVLLADSNNHRVLIYTPVPPASGAAATQVLGQVAFAGGSACKKNRDTGVAGLDTLSFPSDVWTDGRRVLVVDQDNHRVLLWSEFPTANGAPADVVLGQPDGASVLIGAGDDGLEFPAFVTSNGNQIFVADRDNHRVLVWDQFPSTSGAPADRVLGQEDFAGDAANAALAAPTASTLNKPQGLRIVGTTLWVTDGGNHRVLGFDHPSSPL